MHFWGVWRKSQYVFRFLLSIFSLFPPSVLILSLNGTARSCYGQEQDQNQTVPFSEGINTEERKKKERKTDQGERI